MKIAMCDKDGKLRQVRCPFGIRDLSEENCYDGMGRNRCKYFKKYEHNAEKHQSYIVCRGNINLLQQEIPFEW